MSEDDGRVPAALILDVSVLTEIARGDTDIMTLIQDYDAAGQPMVVPALAVTAASIDMPNGSGSFGFIAVQGEVDCREVECDGRPGVEFSWGGQR